MKFNSSTITAQFGSACQNQVSRIAGSHFNNEKGKRTNQQAFYALQIQDKSAAWLNSITMQRTSTTVHSSV